MPSFAYVAVNPAGRTVESTGDADTEVVLRAELRARGLRVLRLVEIRGPGAWRALAVGRAGLSHRQFLIFVQELLALIKAGLPILRAIDLLAARQPDGPFQAALKAVHHDLHGGASLSNALGRAPRFFPELFCASVRSGEQTGSLPVVLKRYTDHLKQIIGVREKVVKALSYPVFLVVVGLAVMAFLLGYVMPTFSEIYAGGHRMLPLPTRMVLSLVGVLRDGAAWWGGALVFGTAALWLRSRRPAGRVQLRRAQLSIPIVGTVLLKSEIVRLCRTLSTMLRNGMPILAALRATARAMTIPVVVDALEGATVRVSQGSSLAAALRAQGVMPDLTLEMIEVGETTGSLDAMLDDVADFHEGELDLLLSQATAWLEPVLLLVMGVMVGGIVIAMYLPIFELAGTL